MLLMSLLATPIGLPTFAQNVEMRVDDGRPLPIVLTDTLALDTTVSVNQDSLRATVAERSAPEFIDGYGTFPSLISQVTPRWPSEASHQDTARVIIKCLVDTTGRVVMAVVLKSSNAKFNKASLRAVMQSMYKRPSRPMWLPMPFVFRPDRGNENK